jgi:hypothetical protein
VLLLNANSKQLEQDNTALCFIIELHYDRAVAFFYTYVATSLNR